MKMVFEGQLVHKVYKVYKVLLDQKARKGIKVTVVKKAQRRHGANRRDRSYRCKG